MKKWSWLVAPAIVIALAAMPAHAGGKGGGSKGGGKGLTAAAADISLNQDPATLRLGSTVTFGYVADSSIKTPEINVACYQNGSQVWGETEFASGNSFVLGGTFWSPWLQAGGGASCVARLFYFDHSDAPIDLASRDFDVA
jgi:hypothetical protein